MASDVSPEVLKALAELIKAASSSGGERTWITPEWLKAIAEVIGAVAWPLALMTGLFTFRKQIVAFLGGVDVVEVFGAKISRTITQQLEISAKEASERVEKSTAPTEGEIKRAELVESLASQTDVQIIKHQGEALAVEYERVRRSMSGGDERTRRMEAVVAKMRTIGRAIFPIRHDFAGSKSPGRRLVAIAALQVEPDYEMLTWLAERLRAERPFVSYHALVALLSAIRAQGSVDHRATIEEAVRLVLRDKGVIGSDTDRAQMIAEIEKATKALK